MTSQDHQASLEQHNDATRAAEEEIGPAALAAFLCRTAASRMRFRLDIMAERSLGGVRISKGFAAEVVRALERAEEALSAAPAIETRSAETQGESASGTAGAPLHKPETDPLGTAHQSKVPHARGLVGHCPFCRHDRAELWFDPNDPWKPFQVRCASCGACGPWCDCGWESAVPAWQKVQNTTGEAGAPEITTLPCSTEVARHIAQIARERDEARAEVERLQAVLDSRPAINAGLPETYIRWSQSIYAMEAAPPPAQRQ